MQRKFFSTLLVALLSVALTGCGGGRAQVSGTVTFEDGTPLTKGDIRAIAGDETQVRGNIGQDGSFTLFEAQPGDGIPAGKQYKIWIVNAVDIVYSPGTGSGAASVPSREPPRITQLVHREFTSAETTSLTLDVPAGNSTLTHDITVRRPRP